MTKGLPMTEDQFEDYMQRFPNPDGNCLWCGRPANQYHPVGPITITKSEPDDGDEIWTHEFCCWECLAHWFAEQAGGVFVGDGLT